MELMILGFFDSFAAKTQSLNGVWHLRDSHRSSLQVSGRLLYDSVYSASW